MTSLKEKLKKLPLNKIAELELMLEDRQYFYSDIKREGVQITSVRYMDSGYAA